MEINVDDLPSGVIPTETSIALQWAQLIESPPMVGGSYRSVRQGAIERVEREVIPSMENRDAAVFLQEYIDRFKQD